MNVFLRPHLRLLWAECANRSESSSLALLSVSGSLYFSFIHHNELMSSSRSLNNHLIFYLLTTLYICERLSVTVLQCLPEKKLVENIVQNLILLLCFERLFLSRFAKINTVSSMLKFPNTDPCLVLPAGRKEDVWYLLQSWILRL